MRIPNPTVLAALRTIFDDGAVCSLSDGQLLDRFLGERDEAAELAFALLVRRHGPVVLRVCRRILPDPHDADDAFQATFLVLARKARAIRKRESLPSFLHGVSLRAARDIRAASVRRKKHEGLAALSPAAAVDPTEPDDALHEELARLPGRYRVPIILCELEGLTCEEAAARLGCPVGTIKSRLSRGRERLRARLARRGMAPGVAVGAPIHLPEALVESTARVARPFALGSTSQAVASGVVRAMAAAKARAIAASILVAGIATAVVATGIQGSGPDNPAAIAQAPPVDVREDSDDLPGVITGPSRDEIVALIRRIGRDEPTPQLVAQVTSFFRPRARQGGERWEGLKRRVTDPSFVGRMDALARELSGKPADTRNLITRALADHASVQDALSRAEMRDDLARRAETPRVLRGRVVDSQGNPLPGVSVSTWGALGRSDAQGKFALQLLRPRRLFAVLSLEARGYGIIESYVRWDDIQEGDTHLFRLFNQRMLEGRVVDPDGKPLEGAELELWVAITVVVREGSLDRLGRDPGVGNAVVLRARTDDRGRFAFRGLPSKKRKPGELLHLYAHHPRFEPAEHSFKRNELPRSFIELTPIPGCTVAGTVRDDAGRPVPNAAVRMERAISDPLKHRPETITDEAGRYRIDSLAPGYWMVVVEPERQASAIAVATARREAPVQLDITVPAGGFLAGRVIGPDGQPCASAAVGWLTPLDKAGGPAEWARTDRITHTDADGSFRLGPVPLGRYKILGLIGSPRSEAYVTGETGQTDLVIRHEPAAR